MMQYFQLQLEEGREKVIAIQRRYNEQRKALECTLSELHAANRFVEMLKEQKAAVQTDLNRLNGLAHPIRRCNDDILQYIFKWAVELDTSWFRCATRISQVCRRWRNLALKTPVLWTEIEIQMDQDPADIKIFWERTVARIAKGIPPSITLELYGSDSEQEALEAFGFRRVYHVRELTIDVHASVSARRLVSMLWESRSVAVDHLNLRIELHEEDEDENEDHESIVNILPLIRKFKNLSSLAVYGSGWSSFINTPRAPFLDIKTLNISNCYSLNPISLTSLSRLFPNVETLQLADTSFRLDNPNDELWPMLQSLSIEYVNQIPWSHMQMPNLISLSVIASDHELRKDLISFITSHSSLRYLTLLNMDEDMDEENLLDVYNALPHLETLTIDCCEDLADPSCIGLRKIENLRLRDFQGQPLTPNIITEIVKSLFSRITSDMSNLDVKQPAMLSILVTHETEEKDLEWLNSELVSKALESVTEVELQEELYRSYNLKLYDK